MVCRCLVRSTKLKKLFMVLLGVAFSSLFISWFRTNVHSDVSMPVKCSGGVGCSRYYNGTLAQVVSEALETTESSSVRLQVSVTTVLSTSEEKRNHSTRTGRRLTAEGAELSELSLKIDHNLIGHLNFELWTDVEGELVDDLRLDSRFPKHPTKVGNLTRFYSHYGMNVNSYGQRIFGYIVPSVTGLYRFAVASDDTSEVWLSTDHQPKNLRKICCVGCIDPKDITPRHIPPAPPLFISFSRKNFNVHSRQISEPVMLERGVAYFVEVYHKDGTEEDYVLVKWQLPGKSDFVKIPPKCFAMAESLLVAEADKGVSHLPALEGPYPSHKLQRSVTIPYIGDDIVDTVVLTDVVPKCDYYPSYAYVHKVKRYTGVFAVEDSFVYPDDHTELDMVRRNKWKAEGNPIIDPSEVTMIINSFINYLNSSEHGYRYDRFSLRLLELTNNSGGNGSRLLLEGDVHWNDGQSPTSISQYLYYQPPSRLCLVNGFQWERKTHVNLILTVKNLGRWFKHAVRNLEKIYLLTKDDLFTLIVCDFASTDVNITQVLLESRLRPHMYKVINMGETFMKTVALQAGIDSVKDPNQIVMTMDLHLTLPIGFIQAIRKHTIKGRMAYAPIVLRLLAGYSENRIKGFWEKHGYGLLALYKSDWDAIGGQNVKEFRDKWGGEDWETIDRLLASGYEAFRHRYPGTVHYYHTHKGMWDNMKP